VKVGNARSGCGELGAHSDDIGVAKGLEKPSGAQVLLRDDDSEVSGDIYGGVAVERLNWVLVTYGDDGVYGGHLSGGL
jgi:hypothetical protein